MPAAKRKESLHRQDRLLQKAWVSNHGLRNSGKDLAFFEVLGRVLKEFWGYFTLYYAIFCYITLFYIIFPLYYAILRYITLFYLKC